MSPENTNSNSLTLTPEGMVKEAFHVKTKDPYKIFLETDKMNPNPKMTIGKHEFNQEDSIKSALIELQRSNNNFTIFTKININPSNTSKDILPELIKSFKNTEELGGEQIIFGLNKTAFKFNIDPLNNTLEIKTGNIIIQDNKKIFNPGIEINQDNVTNAVGDASGIIETTIKKIHELNGMPIPNVELILHPPEEQITRVPEKAHDTQYDEESLLKLLEIPNPHVSFDNIGGNEEAKEELQGLSQAIENPLEYRLDGLKPPKGILLYGPPGTGKTKLVKALASKTGAQFLYLKGSDIYSRWVGDSEKFLDAVFKLARNSKKRTIIFLDEIDKITPRITSESNEVTNRVSGTLQTLLDGMESNENFTVVAATNRLDLVNPAVIRPGRFTEMIEVGLPNEEARKGIFDIHIKDIQNISNEASKEIAYLEAKEKIDAHSAKENWDIAAKEKAYAEAKKTADTALGPKLFEDPDFNALLPETNGLSGADIANIIDFAAKERSRQKEKSPINTELFKKFINKRKEEIKKQQTGNKGNEAPQNSKYNVPIYE